MLHQVLHMDHPDLQKKIKLAIRLVLMRSLNLLMSFMQKFFRNLWIEGIGLRYFNILVKDKIQMVHMLPLFQNGYQKF